MSQGLDMWSVIVLVSVCGLAHGSSRVDPLVSTKAGLIRGLQSDKGYAKFLGVPYGVVDKNNPFGPASPHPIFDNIFEAYEANSCPQVNGGHAVGTLDCLSVNIYVPNTANSQNRLPVMVWIHGGAFVGGSAYNDAGDPSPLLRHDVIVVGINYRLGVYGFMCLDIPEVPGNQGLKDQVLALRWIQENIEAFGGNSRQITVFGESAGGMSVNFHLLSSYENLFQRAIIQSGPAISPWAMSKTNNSIPLRLAKALNFETDNVNEAVAYLSSIDVNTLVTLATDMKITGSIGDEPFTKPCVEKNFEGVENFITDHPLNIRSNKVSNIPVIIGNNDNELGFKQEASSVEALLAYINELLGMSFNIVDDLTDVIEDLRHFYIGDEELGENMYVEITDFASDFVFNHPTQVTTELFLESGAKNVYRYLFGYRGGRNNNMMNMSSNLTATGAAHGDELGYLFDSDSTSGGSSPEDQLVVDRLTMLWTNFAKYGNPVPSTSELLPVTWEPVTRTSQPYLEINSDIALKARPFHGRMAFWDLFYKVYGTVPKV